MEPTTNEEYFQWCAKHRENGFVLNMWRHQPRLPIPEDFVLHRAWCTHVTNPDSNPIEGGSRKRVSVDSTELRDFCFQANGFAPHLCSRCNP